MHSRDCRWPAGFAVVAVLLVMFLVAFIIPYGLTGESLQWLISQIDWSSLTTWQNLYLLVVVAIFCLTSLSFTLRARRRERARVKALAGDVSAMSAASITLEAPSKRQGRM